MVKKFLNFLKERWDMVPAAPVVVLPFESDEPRSDIERKKTKGQATLERDQSSSKTV